MIKISFVQTDMARGGAERRIANIANALVLRGFDVHIALYKSGEVAYYLEQAVKVLTLNTIKQGAFERFLFFTYDTIMKMFFLTFRICAHIVRPFCKTVTVAYLELFQRFEYERKYGRNIRKYVRTNQDRVILSFTSSTVLEVAPALNKIRPKAFIISESADPSWNVTPEFERKREECYKKADVCVFQTPGALEYFPPYIREKGTVIPNPIGRTIPDPYTDIRKKAIVNFCRIDAVKNLDMLIDAFSLVHRKHSDFELYIYGDEPDYLLHLHYKDHLTKKINALGMNKMIHILPSQDNIHEIIKDYSMYVSSSDHEGLSNSMLEAMALGLPVICTDCPSGGAAFVIENYRNGILVPVGDVEKMAEAICYMIENPKKAQEMANQAVKIKERFNEDAICDKWVELIERVSGVNAQ